MSATCTWAVNGSTRYGLRFCLSGVYSGQECALALRWLQRACQLASGPCIPSQHWVFARQPTCVACIYSSTGAELGVICAGALGDSIAVLYDMK